MSASPVSQSVGGCHYPSTVHWWASVSGGTASTWTIYLNPHDGTGNHTFPNISDSPHYTSYNYAANYCIVVPQTWWAYRGGGGTSPTFGTSVTFVP